MSRFEYPNACCRCAAEQPAQTWGVQSYDSKPGPGNSVVTITYTVPVPVCVACHRSLTILLSICWFAALCVGGVSGWFIYDWAMHRPYAETYPPVLMVGMSVLLGGMIAWATVWTLKAIFINYDFAYFDPGQQRMVFKNKRYQQIFDQINNTAPERAWG